MVNDMEAEILHEDIGFDLSQFDLELLYDEEKRRPIKEDAQTVNSFGAALGKRQQEQQDDDSKESNDTHESPLKQQITI